MTRRERLEQKLDKREDWAAKARARSDEALSRAHALGQAIPMGQPVLVGHHSERRHRRDLERIDANMAKGVEQSKLAEHHDAKRRGLEIQLDRTIFDDDPDAIDRLEARIREREASAAQAAAVNRAWRKGGVEGVRAAFDDRLAQAAAETMRMAPWLKSPLSTTSDRAAIRADKERIAIILAKRQRAEAAAAALGGVLIEGESYVRVTFPERPSREVLSALRAASFRFSGGSWHGARQNIPDEVAALVTPPASSEAAGRGVP